MKILLHIFTLCLLFSEAYAQPFVEPTIIQSTVSPSDWTELTHSNNVPPNYNVVFNQEEILRIDISISDTNWEAMRSDLDSFYVASCKNENTPTKPLWFPCTISYNEKQWQHVGIRYKGNFSLRSPYREGDKKLSFKLDFDEFEDDYPSIKNQRFYGFKQLNLNNNYRDTAYVCEKVAADLFREFGIISAQTTFCEVYVDNGSGLEYFGLYTLVEEMDDSVIKSQTGEKSGNIYKPEGRAASFYAGTYNESELGKKNNKDKADYSDVKALYETLNSNLRSSDIQQWKDSLESIFNVDGFLKWLAANTVIQNWDTYGNMHHNYFLYNHSVKKLTWIPWDNNEALWDRKGFRGALSISLDETEWPLIRYLIDDSGYQKTYKNYLFQFADKVFNPIKTITAYNTHYERIKESVYAEQADNTSIFDAIEKLKIHVQERYDSVIAYCIDPHALKISNLSIGNYKLEWQIANPNDTVEIWYRDSTNWQLLTKNIFTLNQLTLTNYIEEKRLIKGYLRICCVNSEGFVYGLDERKVNTLTVSVIEPNTQDIKIYPNPAKDFLYIQNLPEQIKVTIYNLCGTQLETKLECGNKLDISNLSSGVYILKAGNSIKKFIVE